MSRVDHRGLLLSSIRVFLQPLYAGLMTTEGHLINHVFGSSSLPSSLPLLRLSPPLVQPSLICLCAAAFSWVVAPAMPTGSSRARAIVFSVVTQIAAPHVRCSPSCVPHVQK